MSTTITPDMVREAYTVARRVHKNEITRQEGFDDLVKRVKYNASSAADAIDNLGHMLSGREYKRLNNLFTMSHFLDMVHQDYGVSTQRAAAAPQ